MLRFLKNFRKHSIEQSKMKKVILYAIGEIFLVVIGILIAVQLNNWNNQRKLDRAESVTLNRLYEDLLSDQERFVFLDSAMKYNIAVCDTVINLIENQTSTEDRMELIKYEPTFNFILETNTTTYDEMINTGRLYSLSSRRLRSWIALYYRQARKWGGYSDDNTKRLQEAVTQPTLNDYWVIQNKLNENKRVSLKKYPWLTQVHSNELKAIEHLTYLTRSMLLDNLRNYDVVKGIHEGLMKDLKLNRK